MSFVIAETEEVVLLGIADEGGESERDANLVEMSDIMKKKEKKKLLQQSFPGL